MKNRRMIWLIVAAVAITVVILLCVAKPKPASQEPVVEEVSESEEEWIGTSAINVDEEVVILRYPGDPDFPEYYTETIPDTNLREEEFWITAKGDIVPSMMTASAVNTNCRYIKELNLDSECDYFAYGPSISINGYTVKPGDFFCTATFRMHKETNPRQYYDTCYYIRSGALQQAGLEVLDPQTTGPGADFFLSMGADSRGLINMSELELDVTFTLEDYDVQSNTYYFSAVNNGPFSGTSNYFYSYYDGYDGKCFPTDMFESERTLGIVEGFTREYCYVQFSYENNYWSWFGADRNELRHKYNEQYGTHYEDLDYSGDVDVKGKDYLEVIYPTQYAIWEKQEAEAEEWYNSHPEELEDWRAHHPGWEDGHYSWDDPWVYSDEELSQ